MQSIIEYLTENIQNIFESKSLPKSSRSLPSSKSLKETYKKLFGYEWYNKCGNKNLKGSRQCELIRCYLGEKDDEITENALKILNKYYSTVNDDSINITYDIFDEASSVYPAVEIIFKNDVNNEDTHFKYPANTPLYIVNTIGKIKKKELTPANLGIAGISFNSVTNVKDQLNENSKYSANTYKFILNNLIDNIITNCDANTSSFEELVNKSEEINITEISKDDLDESSIKNLFNDFGEILAGIYLLKKLQGEHTLLYPTQSNYPNVDFFIDYNAIKVKDDEVIDPKTITVSVKNEMGSGCSSLSYARGVCDKIKKTNTNFTDDYIKILEQLKNTETGTAKSRIITTDFYLAKLLSSKNTKINKAIKILKDNNLLNNNDNYDSINISKVKNLFNDEQQKLYNILVEYYETLDYKDSDKYDLGSIDNSNLLKKIPNNDKILEGMFVYPLRSKMVEYINDTYGENGTKDISNTASFALSYYQIHLKYNGNTCKFTLKNMSQQDGKWKLIPGGSIANPRKKAISIERIN